MSTLYAKITKDFTDNGKGLGSNGLLEILITSENGRTSIAKINVFNDKKNTQILTTFQPLECQQFETNSKGKAIAIKTQTIRYCTAYDSGKVKAKAK